MASAITDPSVPPPLSVRPADPRAPGRPPETVRRARAWGREMREVHLRLREALVLAREAIEDEADVDPLAGTPLLYCWGFCTALSSHHAGEDGALFPRLVERHPDLGPVVRQLRQDHSMIEHLIGGLRRALDDGATTAEKLRHLDGVEAVVESHFRFEERRLLDLLDRIDDVHPGPRELYGALAD